MPWPGDGLRRWWPPSQAGMGPDGVVVLSPLFDDNPGLSHGVEDLAIEQFVSELTVEGLAVAVLPRAAGFDKERPHLQLAKPFPHGDGRHLRAIVAADASVH